MEAIKAFVGHSFSEDDQSVVAAILQCLNRVAQIHPRFSWEHAEEPEPTLVPEKVLARIADKNLFIAICTRKERVVSPLSLKKPPFLRGFVYGNEIDFAWKTSDWILQEIGLAVGRGLKIILLIEEGVRAPGALQGNLEYITFQRSIPERCYDRLIGMVAASSPQQAHTAVVELQATVETKSCATDLEKEEESALPRPEENWSKRQYELALFKAVFRGDQGYEKLVFDAFLASSHANTETSRTEWDALREYARVVFEKGGDLPKIERMAVGGSEDVQRYLALTYRRYELHEKAAKAFEAAASRAPISRKLVLLGDAALSYKQAGNNPEEQRIVVELRTLCSAAPSGEKDVLHCLVELASDAEDNEIALAALERLVELDPGDAKQRFSLAYKYADMDRNDLAAYHYSRIPRAARGGAEWNNLGVALERVDLPIKAVAGYREAEALGETLAMSNLAKKLLSAGFLEEAESVLEKAILVRDHHLNVDSSMATVKGAVEEEDKKEAVLFKKIKPVCDFYRAFGRCLASGLEVDITGKWKGPVCELIVSLDGGSLVAVGTWESAGGLGLMTAIYGLSKTTPAATLFRVEYRGVMHGRAFIGTVKTTRSGPNDNASKLLGGEGGASKVLLWIADDGQKMHVAELSESGGNRFYEFQRLSSAALAAPVAMTS